MKRDRIEERPRTQPANPVPARRESGARRALPFALLAVVVALVFANSLENGFHLDDFYRIRDNPEIRELTPVWRHFVDPGTISGSRGISESLLHRIGQYRPLLPLTLSINYALGGHSLVGYHVGNVLLHLAGSALVYLLALALLGRADGARFSPGGRRWAALAVASIYAVHPVSGIPVNYVLARDLLLMQVFLLGALLAYMRAREPGTSLLYWALALVCFELAVMSKTTAAVMPLLVFAFEVTVGRARLRDGAPWRRATPFAAAFAIHAAFVQFFLDFGDLARVQSEGIPYSWTYALTQAQNHLFEYLKNFLWPFAIRMAPYVEPAGTLRDPDVLAGLALIVGSLGIAWGVRKRAPVVAFGILAYWILMLPESSFVPISHLAVHYRPFPSSPYLFLVGTILVGRALAPRPALAVGVAAVAYFAVASVWLNRTYRTEETLWSHSVRHGGEALAHMNLAMSIADRSDPRVQRHLREAIRMTPNYVLAHINLGLWLIDRGEVDAGIERMRLAENMAPDWPEPHYWLSRAYARLGRTAEAASEGFRAAELDPGNIEYLYAAAERASELGRFAVALDYVRRVQRIDPGYREISFLEGYLQQVLGRTPQAIEAYRAALERDPGSLPVEFNLGYAYLTVGDCTRATTLFTRVLEREPGHEEARRWVDACRGATEPAVVESVLGDRYEAAFAGYRSGDYRRSLEAVGVIEAIRPDYEETQFLKGFDLQMLGRLEEAVEAYRRYLRRRPDDPQVRFNVAHALMRLDRCDEALEHFRRTLELRPDYAEARSLMEECRARSPGAQAALNEGDAG